MIPQGILDRRPIVVALAGPNGAGKTTFWHAHLGDCGLRLVNADVLSAGLDIDPYAAARLADSVRRALLSRRESFVFETVFSDPAGDKLAFLGEAAAAGYAVVLCWIGLGSVEACEERVAMRVSQGGHDVPAEKLRARLPRGLANLRRAIRDLPHVLIFDNTDLCRPYRLVATFEAGRATHIDAPPPRWLADLIETG